MKLYELKRGDKYTLAEASDTKVPPCAAQPKDNEVYTFRNLDGMYSYNHDSKGNVVHFAAWTEVEPCLP